MNTNLSNDYSMTNFLQTKSLGRNFTRLFIPHYICSSNQVCSTQGLILKSKGFLVPQSDPYTILHQGSLTISVLHMKIHIFFSYVYLIMACSRYYFPPSHGTTVSNKSLAVSSNFMMDILFLIMLCNYQLP